ncbi:hypothetical protein ACFXGA_18185 [Actinosynnema sp. NPDC059335]|uniref:hypothetical protein n=1 Tax=Actinosynnema sp. NPDC059335 TaxID=3346804 RepID=UPI00366CE903
MRLIRAERRSFAGTAAFLADDGHREVVTTYFTDLARSLGDGSEPDLAGHSYGEMAGALLPDVVPDGEPVDLLVLAYAIHDMWPGRATATYLSHLCPGTPRSFAVCDQGSAAPFTALRIIRDHGARRALLIVAEQASLPYRSAVTPPAEHRAVALLYGDDAGARVTDVRQYPDVHPAAVPELASRGVAELSAGHGARVVLGDALADAWPGHDPGHERVPAGQPTTGVWWHLAGAFADSADPVVIADYDPALRYLCLAAVSR